jgi:hypothetical protein
MNLWKSLTALTLLLPANTAPTRLREAFFGRKDTLFGDRGVDDPAANRAPIGMMQF